MISILIFIKLNKNTSINEEGIHEYNVETPIKASGKNMNYCKPGCVRGVCNRKDLTKNHCIHDFDCNYCQDKDTNMFYVNFNNDRYIIPLYEEEHKLNKNQVSQLNKDIKINNNYIHQLNNKIKLINS